MLKPFIARIVLAACLMLALAIVASAQPSPVATMSLDTKNQVLAALGIIRDEAADAKYLVLHDQSLSAPTRAAIESHMADVQTQCNIILGLGSRTRHAVPAPAQHRTLTLTPDLFGDICDVIEDLLDCDNELADLVTEDEDPGIGWETWEFVNEGAELMYDLAADLIHMV